MLISDKRCYGLQGGHRGGSQGGHRGTTVLVTGERGSQGEYTLEALPNVRDSMILGVQYLTDWAWIEAVMIDFTV